MHLNVARRVEHGRWCVNGVPQPGACVGFSPLSRPLSKRSIEASAASIEHGSTQPAPESSAKAPPSRVSLGFRLLHKQQPSKPVDPFATKTVYSDSLLDRTFITILTRSLQHEMALEGQHVPLPQLCTYDDLVRASKEVMKFGRSPAAQAALVRRCLSNLVRNELLAVYRLAFPPSQWTAEVNAVIAAQSFKWLVGETEVQSAVIKLGEYEATRLSRPTSAALTPHPGRSPSPNISATPASVSPIQALSSREQTQDSAAMATAMGHEATGAPGPERPTFATPARHTFGPERVQHSVVKIKKCRFLEVSGCVGVCNNLCKSATEGFFANNLQLPLYMKPNFEDLSCEMIFGMEPPPRELDPALKQPCFKLQCSQLLVPQDVTCHKVTTQQQQQPDTA